MPGIISVGWQVPTDSSEGPVGLAAPNSLYLRLAGMSNRSSYTSRLSASGMSMDEF